LRTRNFQQGAALQVYIRLPDFKHLRAQEPATYGGSSLDRQCRRLPPDDGNALTLGDLPIETIHARYHDFATTPVSAPGTPPKPSERPC
jgi:hypothetical protein